MVYRLFYTNGGNKIMTKMCPLIKIADPSYPSYCSENGCAWWDDECKCCCVKSLIYNKRILPIQPNYNNGNS